METELRHALSTAERAVAEVEEQLAAQERAHEEQSGVQQQLMHQAYASTQALERGLEEQRDAAAAEAARHAAQLASVEAGALLSHPYS